MPPLREGLLFNRTTQADLTEFGRPGRELIRDTAGAFSLAAQHRYERSRRSELRTATKHLLKSLVAQLLQVELIAQSQYFIDQLPVQALTMLGLLAVQFRQPLFIGSLAVGDNPGPPAFFGPAPFAYPTLTAFRPDPAVRLVVVGIVGSPLSCDLPLQTGDFLVASFQFRPKQAQFGGGFSHNRYRLRPDVQAHRSDAQCVFGLLIGPTLVDQLHVEAVAPIQLAPHQAHVLDRAVQAVLGDGIVIDRPILYQA